MESSPLVLAIETSTALLGVALIQGNESIWENTTVDPRAHSSRLLPLCAKALADLGVGPRDLAAVAVSAGPGSFTGLRIGFATAQGLCAGTGAGIVPVPTFEAMLSQNAGVPNLAVVQGSAKAQTVAALYTRSLTPSRSAGFAASYGYDESMPPSAVGMDEFLREAVSLVSGPIYVAGDAAVEFVASSRLDGRNVAHDPEVILVDDRTRLPLPSTVGLIGSRMLAEGKAVPPEEAVPRYYRRSQAEVKAMESYPEISIENMTLDDLDRVLEIEAQSYKTPWSRRAFTSEVSENSYAHYYVCRMMGRIVGYVGMWVILDEAHITNIAVDPECRRQRIGQRMLEAMFDKARHYGATRMTLEVRVTNSGAQTLYKKLGFVERGLRKGYYTDTNEDAIIMWKDDLGPQRPKAEQVKWMV